LAVVQAEWKLPEFQPSAINMISADTATHL
jgi:hypothetical protein